MVFPKGFPDEFAGDFRWNPLQAEAVRLRGKPLVRETSEMRFLSRFSAWAVIGVSFAAASLAAAQGSASAPQPTSPGPATASYVAATVNGGKLPSTDQVTDADGARYLVEFDELVLSIRPNFQFRAALRYRQALAVKGIAMGREPIQSMTVYGRYEVRGSQLRFIPDPKRGGRGIEILDGTYAGRTIQVPFWYRNGSVSRQAQVLLKRDDSRF